MNPVERLKETIRNLFGSSNDPEQIRKMCQDRHIQGFTVNSTSCPMVKLVREQVDFPVAFTFGKKEGSGRWIYYSHTSDISIPSPMVCEIFADNFDNKVYPELIANDTNIQSPSQGEGQKLGTNDQQPGLSHPKLDTTDSLGSSEPAGTAQNEGTSDEIRKEDAAAGE